VWVTETNDQNPASGQTLHCAAANLVCEVLQHGVLDPAAFEFQHCQPFADCLGNRRLAKQ
jgi:hypothetical protein